MYRELLIVVNVCKYIRLGLENLIFCFVNFNRCCMSEKLMMTNDVWFSARISTKTMIWLPRRTSTGRIGSLGIAAHAEAPWLIQGHPVLYSISKFFEAKFSIVSKIIAVINFLKHINFTFQTNTSLFRIKEFVLKLFLNI